MSNNFPTYDALDKTKAESLTLLQKLALWFRDFLENAE